MRQLGLGVMGACCALGTLAAGPAMGDVQFCMGRMTWASQQQVVQQFDLSASNLAKAVEVASPPAHMALLGRTLTFELQKTGLDVSFVLQGMSLDSNFQYRSEGYVSPQAFPPQIPSGWQVSLTGGSDVYGFGFQVIDDENAPDVIQVYGKQGNLIGSMQTSQYLDDRFIGCTSSEPIGRVEYHDYAGNLDMLFVDDLSFGLVPEPGSLGVLVGAGLLALRRRR